MNRFHKRGFCEMQGCANPTDNDDADLCDDCANAYVLWLKRAPGWAADRASRDRTAARRCRRAFWRGFFSVFGLRLK